MQTVAYVVDMQTGPKKKYWLSVVGIMKCGLDMDFSNSSEVILLNHMPMFLKEFKTFFCTITATRISFVRYWKSDNVPPIEEWLMNYYFLKKPFW